MQRPELLPWGLRPGRPPDSGKHGSSGQGRDWPPVSWHQGEEGDGGGRVTCGGGSRGPGISAHGLAGGGQQDEMTSVQGVQLSRGCKISFRGGHCAVAEAPAGPGRGEEGVTAAWLSLGKGWPSKRRRRGPASRASHRRPSSRAGVELGCRPALGSCPRPSSPGHLPADPSLLQHRPVWRVGGGWCPMATTGTSESGRRGVRCWETGAPARSTSRPPPRPEGCQLPHLDGPHGPRRALGPHTVRGALPWGPSLLRVTCRKGPCGCSQGERVARP